MTRAIHEDWAQFRDVISGRTRKELRRLVKSGGFTRLRPDGTRFRVNVPGIEEPHFVFGDNGEGIGRGPGKEGDVVGRDPQRQPGNKPGDEHADGITVGVDLDEFLRFLQVELELPDMKPKPNETYEEIKIRYNSISKIGDESRRHTRRTILEALKRLAASGEADKLYLIPGMSIPTRQLTLQNSDKRYRQYNEIKIPSSNAAIFFVRDCSGSVDDYRCDVISDMCWWIDIWIRKFYERVERVYMIHDTEASEVSPDTFYSYRAGGGTKCSSPFQLIPQILENRFSPMKYNIYIFYFSDGDNWGSDDNAKIVDILGKQLGPDIVNMVGFTEVCPYGYGESLKKYLDKHLQVGNEHVAKLGGYDHVRTALIAGDKKPDWEDPMSDDERDEQIMGAIKAIIGKERNYG